MDRSIPIQDSLKCYKAINYLKYLHFVLPIKFCKTKSFSQKGVVFTTGILRREYRNTPLLLGSLCKLLPPTESKNNKISTEKNKKSPSGTFWLILDWFKNGENGIEHRRAYLCSYPLLAKVKYILFQRDQAQKNQGNKYELARFHDPP